MIENKEWETKKERQEKQRGGKVLKARELTGVNMQKLEGFAAECLILRGFYFDLKIPGGNADGCENKGVAKKATQKMLKTKE